MINLLQCGSRRLNSILQRELISLHFKRAWHTRFTNMLRFFRFVARYFPKLHTLQINLCHAYGLGKLSHEIGDTKISDHMVGAFKRDVAFPKLLHLVIREDDDHLVVLHLARLFNTLQNDTSDVFPVLQTLKVECGSTNADRYAQAFEAFAAHTPVSVTSFALQLTTHSIQHGLPSSRRYGRDSIMTARQHRPKLSLHFLTLNLDDDTLQWNSLASAYQLDNLVELTLAFGHKMDIDCSILPRSLQALYIRLHIKPTTRRADVLPIVELQNPPPFLETMLFIGRFDIMVRDALPSRLETFAAPFCTLHDFDGKVAVPLLPRGLKLMACGNVKNSIGSAPVRLCEYWFGHLVNADIADGESMLKRLPPHLSLIAQSTAVIQWLCAFAHLPIVGMFAVPKDNHWSAHKSIYQCVIENDATMTADKKSTLEAHSLHASNCNHWLRRRMSFPKRQHGIITSMDDIVHARDQLACVNGLIVRKSGESLRVLHNDSGASIPSKFQLKNVTILDVLPACTRLRHLEMNIEQGLDLAALFSCLPPTLQTLKISLEYQEVSSSHLHLLHPDMTLRYLRINNSKLSVQEFRQIVDDVKSNASQHQFVLSATVVEYVKRFDHMVNEYVMSKRPRNVTVHCHSVNVDALFPPTQF